MQRRIQRHDAERDDGQKAEQKRQCKADCLARRHRREVPDEDRRLQNHAAKQQSYQHHGGCQHRRRLRPLHGSVDDDHDA